MAPVTGNLKKHCLSMRICMILPHSSAVLLVNFIGVWCGVWSLSSVCTDQFSRCESLPVCMFVKKRITGRASTSAKSGTGECMAPIDLPILSCKLQWLGKHKLAAPKTQSASGLPFAVGSMMRISSGIRAETDKRLSVFCDGRQC